MQSLAKDISSSLAKSGMTLHIVIYRNNDGRPSSMAVDEDSALSPGDTAEVSLSTKVETPH
jgi:hypothetical protein